MKNVLAKYGLEHCEEPNEKALDNIAKKVIKEWKKLILVFNLKTA